MTDAERDLSLPREKPPLLFVRAGYAMMRAGRAVFGRRRMLRLSLNMAWLMRRMAHELSGEVFGTPYHCASMGLTEKQLARWVPSGGSVLDVGCGTGRWSRMAARQASRVVGIDHSAANLAAARAVETPAHVEYRLGDVTQALGGERFDTALLVHVLEHVEDADRLLRAIAGCARTLVIEVPDVESDGLNLVRRQMGCPWYSDADHVREYSADILRAQLERNQWQLQTIAKERGTLVAVATAVVPRAAAAEQAPAMTDAGR